MRGRQFLALVVAVVIATSIAAGILCESIVPAGAVTEDTRPLPFADGGVVSGVAEAQNSKGPAAATTHPDFVMLAMIGLAVVTAGAVLLVVHRRRRSRSPS